VVEPIAHAVTVALHENGRDRVNDARESGRRIQLAQHHSPYAVAPTGESSKGPQCRSVSCRSRAAPDLGLPDVATIRLDVAQPASVRIDIVLRRLTTSVT
jgi:hypothetical protein